MDSPIFMAMELVPTKNIVVFELKLNFNSHTFLDGLVLILQPFPVD